MRILVEPQHGHELDRLVTALLNATGVVHRAIEDTAYPPGSYGVEVIGVVANRLRGSLTLLAEQRSDEQLALATQVLAEATLLMARDLGLERELQAAVGGDGQTRARRTAPGQKAGSDLFHSTPLLRYGANGPRSEVECQPSMNHSR